MRTLGRFAVAVTLAGLGLALGMALLVPLVRGLLTSATTGSKGKIDLSPLAQRSVVHARDGSVLQVLHAEEDRVPVPLDRVPPRVINAVLDVEDSRFFHHGPVDLRSMARAFATNVSVGEIREGGSTITQQLVKNSLLTPRQDLQRKVKEAALAVRLSGQMSKQEILERYLNTVYFGNGAYGIQAAAERYFATDVERLTQGQAALLAGLIRNPVGYDPFRYPSVSRQRRDKVIDRMHHLGHVDAEEARRLKEEPLPEKPADLPAERDDYFTEVVKQQLLGDRSFRLGETGQDRYRSVFEGGLRIHTTLDPADQRAAEDKVRTILPDTQGRFKAALVSIDPANGAVRALVGGDDFDRAKFNLATDMPGRQPGSAFKPFTLMAALEQRRAPGDTIDGSSPCSIPNPGGTPNPWVPSNVEGEEAGVMTLTDAMVHSVNCAFARLIKVVGPRAVADVARRMGITNALGEHLSLTLGASEVTPLQMASAYATLAADGELHRPYFVERIDDRSGRTLWRAEPKGERAVPAQLARVGTAVLQQVVQRGTGRSAAVPGWEVAGKTGTTDDFKNAWFVGYTKRLSTAVWMGSPTAYEPMYNVGGIRVYGGTYPARIWGAFMREALAGEPVVKFARVDPSALGGGRYLRVTGEARPGTSLPSGPRKEAVEQAPAQRDDRRDRGERGREPEPRPEPEPRRPPARRPDPPPLPRLTIPPRRTLPPQTSPPRRAPFDDDDDFDPFELRRRRESGELRGR